MVVILCQRYGPSLEPAGFPALSATHLEYREARKLGKPIRMYVRDRLEADYHIHRKNKKKAVQLLWVQDDGDRRLFELIGEHRSFAKGKPGSNWCDTFRDSLELKTLIKRDFGPIAARNELESLIVENRVPLIDVQQDVKTQENGPLLDMTIHTRFRNVGTVPAYSFSWQIEGFEKMAVPIPVLAPGQETRQGTLLSRYDGSELEQSLTMTYFLAQGHKVFDEYWIGVRMLPGRIISSGAKFRSKTYQVASGEVRPFVIGELE